MTKNSVELLELLRKRGMDGDVGFLREALQVPVEGITDAEVSVLSMGSANQIASPNATVTGAEIGTPGRLRWSCAFPSWTFRISSGVSKGIDKSVVQSDWEFPYVGVGNSALYN